MDFNKVLQEILEERRRILVVGLGISGIESAAFCCRMGIPAVCVERMSEQEYLGRSKFPLRLDELRAAGVELHFGIDGEGVGPYLDRVALGVLSPGVSHESAIFGSLHRRGLPLVSELELGIELYRGMGSSRSIVVTGSNGKSTTVSLIHHILNQAGLKSVLCGNVGVPVVAGLGGRGSEQDGPRDEVLVVEASSYQLEACTVLKPYVAALLNLSDNHLERHGTMERYFAAKARMFACQDQSDCAILNADDQWSQRAASKLKSKVLWFGAVGPEKEKLEGAFFEYHPREGMDSLTIRFGKEQETFDLETSRLLGTHNRYNIAVALLAAQLSGVKRNQVLDALASFQPLEHRLEFVPVKQAVTVINDSKSTTVAAAVAGFSCVSDTYAGRKITLLLGGLAKAGSWEPLMARLKTERQRLRSVLCFGQDGRIIANHCQAAGLPYRIISSLKEATQAALVEAAPGEIVLLSPGCASFDEFSDFEERGRKFKQYLSGE